MIIKLISLIPIINVCLCLGLGVFTLSRNPKHVANIGFLFGMLSLAILTAGDAIPTKPLWTESPEVKKYGLNVRYSST